MSVREMALCATVALLGAASLAGCGGSDKPAATSSPSPSVYSGGTSTAPTQQPSPEPTRSSSSPSKAPPDPRAPSTIAPVVRNGTTPRPTVTAPATSFQRPVRYSDGVSLTVTKVTQGKVTSQNVGDVAGSTTTFDVTLTNGSSKDLNLENVVATVVYGSPPGRIARPAYGTDDIDFSGVVKPGKNARAVYTFMIPTPSRDAATLYVDFDATHVAAVFTGSTLG